MLITLLRNADRVKIACLAQLVNVIAPIMTRNGGGCWAQTIYYPFLHASSFGRGTSLRALVDSPVYDCRDYEGVPLIDATATLGGDGCVTVFCVNRDLREDFALEVDLHGFGNLRIGEHILLHHDDVHAVNTEELRMPSPRSPVPAARSTVKRPRPRSRAELERHPLRPAALKEGENARKKKSGALASDPTSQIPNGFFVADPTLQISTRRACGRSDAIADAALLWLIRRCKFRRVHLRLIRRCKSEPIFRCKFPTRRQTAGGSSRWARVFHSQPQPRTFSGAAARSPRRTKRFETFHSPKGGMPMLSTGAMARAHRLRSS